MILYAYNNLAEESSIIYPALLRTSLKKISIHNKIIKKPTIILKLMLINNTKNMNNNSANTTTNND